MPESLIDFHHFKSLAILNKDLLRPNFGKKTNPKGAAVRETAPLIFKAAIKELSIHLKKEENSSQIDR